MNIRSRCVYTFVFLAVFSLICIQPAVGVEQVDFSQENWYLGGGVSNNSLDNFDDAFGAQVFAGLDLPYKFHPQVSPHAEIGIMSTGDFDRDNFAGTDHTGLWITGLFKLHFNSEVRGLGRLGLDFGDDDGLIVGVGGEFDLGRELYLRGEFVARDDINSFQLNFVQNL